MFCTNCGKEMADSAKFCSACGTKLVKPQSQDTVIQEKETIIAPIEELATAHETEEEQSNEDEKEEQTVPEEEAVIATEEENVIESEDETQGSSDSYGNETEFTDSFDNTGFMLPDETEASRVTNTPEYSERRPINAYGDLDKTQVFIRPPYEYDSENETQAVYIPDGGYNPQQKSVRDYNGYDNANRDLPYPTEYQAEYYPPENNNAPERKVSKTNIIMVACSIMLAIAVGAVAAVIHTL